MTDCFEVRRTDRQNPVNNLRFNEKKKHDCVFGNARPFESEEKLLLIPVPQAAIKINVSSSRSSCVGEVVW